MITGMDDVLRIEKVVENLLPKTARPWTVTVARHDGRIQWSIDVAHEASNGFCFELASARADDVLARLPELLAVRSEELRRLAAAPPLTNASWVMEARTLASIFNWTKTEVRAVVRMLQREHLTDDEAEWLIEWIGRDAPAPTPAHDF
jgi:hypothetical protein